MIVGHSMTSSLPMVLLAIQEAAARPATRDQHLRRNTHPSFFCCRNCQGSHGIQVLDVSDPTSPMVVGSAFDTTARMLRDAWIVSTFERGSSIYAVVGAAGLAEDRDNGIQLISFQRCDNLCLIGEYDHDSNPVFIAAIKRVLQRAVSVLSLVRGLVVANRG